MTICQYCGDEIEKGFLCDECEEEKLDVLYPIETFK